MESYNKHEHLYIATYSYYAYFFFCFSLIESQYPTP